MPQVGQRHVARRFRVGHVRRVREVQRHDQRLGASLEHVNETVLLAAAAEPRRELVLARELERPQVLLFVVGLEDHRLLSLHGLAERRERFARFGRQNGAAARLVGAPRAAVPLRVEQRLLHEGDRPHARVGVGAAEREGAREADALGEIRAQHPLAHTGVAEMHDGGGSAEEPLARHGECRAEAERAERGAARGVILEVRRGAEPRAHLRIPVRGANVAPLRRGVAAEVGVRVDEPGVHREPLELPDPGARRRGHAGPHRRHDTIADHDGGVVENLARSGDHTGTDECMEAGRVGAQAGDRFGAGGLLGLKGAAGHDGQTQQGTDDFHEGLP